MILRELPPSDLAARLAHPGISLRTGPFVVRLQSVIADVVPAFRFLYADFPLDEADGLADFHVTLSRPANLRRWWRRQALLFSGGTRVFDPFAVELALPFLEWGLNWSVSRHAHQYLIVHAAVIERGGRALVLPAPPGSGKSTLCAALVHHGWRLLSDELALVRPEDGRVVPLPRPVSLKNGSIQVIRDLVPGARLGPTSGETAKGTVGHMRPPAESVARAGETALPAWIVFPAYRAGTPARLDGVPRARAFLRVIDNVFNYSVLGRRGFETAANLVDGCACFDFAYGDLREAMAVVAALPSGRS